MQYHPIFYRHFLSQKLNISCVNEQTLRLSEAKSLFFSLSFFLLLLLFSKDEKDCKTDSVREKKKLFKDLKEGANSAGLYLHNIL